MRWIRWRSDPVKRTHPGNGGDVVVEELEPNGFAPAFVKVAGRVYVDVDEFWRIVLEQNGQADSRHSRRSLASPPPASIHSSDVQPKAQGRDSLNTTHRG
jgi:hypothetical protein